MLVYLSTKCENEAFARDAPPPSLATWFFFEKASFKVGSCYRFLWRSVKRKVATPPSIVASIPASDQDLPFPPSLFPRAGGQMRAGVEKHRRDKWGKKRKEEEKERRDVSMFSLPLYGVTTEGEEGKKKKRSLLFIRGQKSPRGHECLFLLSNSCDGKPPSTHGRHKGGGGGNKLIGFRRRRRRPPLVSSASALP